MVERQTMEKQWAIQGDGKETKCRSTTPTTMRRPWLPNNDQKRKATHSHIQQHSKATKGRHWSIRSHSGVSTTWSTKGRMRLSPTIFFICIRCAQRRDNRWASRERVACSGVALLLAHPVMVVRSRVRLEKPWPPHGPPPGKMLARAAGRRSTPPP
jgi:hypothetical protein